MSEAIAAAATARRERLAALGGSPALMTGAILVGGWIFCALFGPLIVPFDPYATDVLHELAPPSLVHWFGTDQLGRDVFSRTIAGARDILAVAPLATLLGTVLGTALGLVSGYFGGIIDDIISRLIDAALALPLVIVALLVLAALGPSDLTVVVVIGVIFAPLIARTVRSAVLAERARDYVEAARLLGVGPAGVMALEILPNVAPPILVEATVRLGYAIFTVASLSFLGFGIQPPSADWGLAISDNYGLVDGGYWWTVAFPALATASLVVGVNLLADGLQRVLSE
ncbi:MAG: ABC transporter permease [Acetobacteraceae bacterium]